MGLRENKFYFEQKFFSKWNNTLIHYAGQEFKQDGLEEWINPVYQPRSLRPSGMSPTAEMRGSLDVVCWAKNDTKAMELADTLITFIHDNVERDKFELNGYQIQDHAWDNSGLTYIYITFDIVSYDIRCSGKKEPNACLKEGTDGTKYGFKKLEFGDFTPPLTIDGHEVTELSWQDDGTFIMDFNNLQLTEVDTVYLSHEYDTIDLKWDNVSKAYVGEDFMIASTLVYHYIDGKEVCMYAESSLPDLFIEYNF